MPMLLKKTLAIAYACPVVFTGLFDSCLEILSRTLMQCALSTDVLVDLNVIFINIAVACENVSVLLP